MNIVEQARRVAGVSRMHPLLDGCTYAVTERWTCSPRSTRSSWWPAHCTGWRAQHALAAALAAGFGPNAVGSRFTFEHDVVAFGVRRPLAGVPDHSTPATTA